MPKIPSDNKVLTSNDVFKAISISESNLNGSVSKISSDISNLVVPIDSLVLDPMNARVHSERNIQSIMESLLAFGQVKPIVVRRSNRTVIAGNGTLESAKKLGWTEIAATFVDMDDGQVASYGLADNRTGELATWDFRIVGKLERLIRDTNESMIGWDDSELNVIRSQLDWIPSEQDSIEESSDDDGSSDGEDSDNGNENGSLTELDKIEFEFEDYVVVQEAIESLRRSEDPEMLDSVALAIICKQWLEMNG